MLRTFTLRLLLAGVLLCIGSARAQTTADRTPARDTFQAIPKAKQAQYRFNFQKNFFPDQTAFQAALKQLNTQVARIETLKGKVLASPQNLYRALKWNDDFSVALVRAYFYLDLKYSTNIRDVTSRDQKEELWTRLSSRLSFINDEIKRISPATTNRYLAVYPLLRPYRYVILESLRWRPHTLSLKEEELLAKTIPLMTQWQSDQYEMLMDRALWGKVRDPQAGWLDVRQDVGRIDNSPVREVRRAGFQKSNAAYRAQRDLFAFNFLNVAKTRNRLAQLRGFRNAQEQAFFDLHLSYSDVENTLNQIQNHGALRKRMQEMSRRRVQSFTGYQKVHLYDMSMVPPGVDKPRFSIEEATRVIKASTAYLGPEWNRELNDLLNPANGRLDIVSGPNRVPNAFATMPSGMKSVFYSYGYEGYLGDVSTLAHESGHAVHNGMLNNARVPAALTNGPSYFTESFAILNELVLTDSLYRREKNPGRKVYYLEQLLQTLMSFYSNARTAAIEKTVYEGVDKATVKTADHLDALSSRIGSKTSIWFTVDPETKNEWQQIPHYYSSPTYYVNYVFADLLAQTYFTMYKKNPQDFARRFTALQRNGFNDTPSNLLKRFLSIDLKSAKTYAAVFAQQEAYLNQLEQLYRQVPVTRQKTAETAQP